MSSKIALFQDWALSSDYPDKTLEVAWRGHSQTTSKNQQIEDPPPMSNKNGS